MAGCILVLGVLALSVGFSAFLGWVAAWILAQFGVHVGWFVCAVSVWLISVIGRSVFGTSK